MSVSVRLFVGNLSYQATEAEVREHFSAIGPLVFIHLPTERESGRRRGIAFIEFQDPAQAEEAIRRFHNQPFQGRPLVVNHAREREAGPDVRRTPSTHPSRTSPDRATEPRPPHRSEARRDFGPDASPRGPRKSTHRNPQSTRPPKGPIRERHSGQFFGGGEDEADGDALSRGSFTRRQSDPEHDDRD